MTISEQVPELFVACGNCGASGYATDADGCGINCPACDERGFVPYKPTTPPSDPQSAGMEERLNHLAEVAARVIHDERVSRTSDAFGHSNPYGECAHPDCVLTRSRPSQPPTVDVEALASMRAALTELLRLYDWRFELAEREKALGPLLCHCVNPAPTGWSEEDVHGHECNRLLVEQGRQRRAVERDLRKYGEQKKAAWEVARKLIESPSPTVRDEGRESS